MREIAEMQQFLNDLEEPIVYAEPNEYYTRDSLPIAKESSINQSDQGVNRAKTSLRSLTAEDVQQSILEQEDIKWRNDCDITREATEDNAFYRDKYAPLKQRSVIFEQSTTAVEEFEEDGEPLPLYPVNSN
jgi:hypothetical protein